MQPGDILANRFELDRLAGSGGMGQVYRARDLSTSAPVAVKLQQPGLSPQDLERFESEAHILAEICHPHIVQYITHGAAPAGERYLVMEWLEGEDLAARLSRAPLTVIETITLGLCVAEALDALHARSIVHRDLKPSNLLVPGGALHQVKLLDFGIARLTHQPHVTRTGMIIGTPGYMAPEQARGERDVNARADVFALGCILFECLTGTPAFTGQGVMEVLAKIVFAEAPPMSSLAADVPPSFEALVTRMLAKDPAARPANGRGVAVELAALRGAERTEPAAEGQRRPSLMRDEQRLLCVVLLEGELRSEVALMPTLTTAGAASLREALQQLAQQYGAHLAMLADGSAAATLIGTAVATDQAA